MSLSEEISEEDLEDIKNTMSPKYAMRNCNVLYPVEEKCSDQSKESYTKMLINFKDVSYKHYFVLMKQKEPTL